VIAARQYAVTPGIKKGRRKSTRRQRLKAHILLEADASDTRQIVAVLQASVDTIAISPNITPAPCRRGFRQAHHRRERSMDN
jgi:hypothetical protein